MRNTASCESLFFDDLAVGNRWETRGRTITETDVVNFAGLTGDYDPLHVDHEFARQTPFGRPIAHGLLGLALVAGLGSHSPAVETVAFLGIREWEFLRPAFIGDTVHAVNVIEALDSNGRKRGRVTWRRQLVNQRGDIIQQGIFETLVAKKPAASRRRDAAQAEREPAKPHIAQRARATRRQK
jgi:acyl dehydratase